MKRTSVMGMTKEQFKVKCYIHWLSFKKHIRIGDWFEALFHTITLGYAKRFSSFIASLLGYQSCRCCERKQWLNRLTNPNANEKCGQIQLEDWNDIY